MKLALTASLAGLTMLTAVAVAADGNQPAGARPPAGGLLVVMPGPIPLRTAKADVVVVGKVTKIEDKTVKAPAFPGAPDKVEYQIAVVNVDDPILNAKGVKEIRVGFQ